MPWLFSYGTLQREDVQRAVFGRRLAGEADALPGFEPSQVRIADPAVAATLGRTHHANVAFTGHGDSRVDGTVFEITDRELAGVDQFEAPFAYRRMAVTLASGREAWVYVHGDSYNGSRRDDEPDLTP